MSELTPDAQQHVRLHSQHRYNLWPRATPQLNDALTASLSYWDGQTLHVPQACTEGCACKEARSLAGQHALFAT
jgi:hypothetical protein